MTIYVTSWNNLRKISTVRSRSRWEKCEI